MELTPNSAATPDIGETRLDCFHWDMNPCGSKPVVKIQQKNSPTASGSSKCHPKGDAMGVEHE